MPTNLVTRRGKLRNVIDVGKGARGCRNLHVATSPSYHCGQAGVETGLKTNRQDSAAPAMGSKYREITPPQRAVGAVNTVEVLRRLCLLDRVLKQIDRI